MDQNDAVCVDRLTSWPVGKGDAIQGWAAGKLEVAICDFKGEVGQTGPVSRAVG